MQVLILARRDRSISRQCMHASALGLANEKLLWLATWNMDPSSASGSSDDERHVRELSARGVAMQRAGDLERAGEAFERAVQLASRAGGEPGGGQHAQALANLAWLRLEQEGETGGQGDAQRLLTLALAARQKALIMSSALQQSPDELCQVALLLKATGEHAAAAALISRACGIYTKRCRGSSALTLGTAPSPSAPR